MNTKQILIIGGVLIVGFLAYQWWKKRQAATATPGAASITQPQKPALAQNITAATDALQVVGESLGQVLK